MIDSVAGPRARSPNAAGSREGTRRCWCRRPRRARGPRRPRLARRRSPHVARHPLKRRREREHLQTARGARQRDRDLQRRLRVAAHRAAAVDEQHEPRRPQPPAQPRAAQRLAAGLQAGPQRASKVEAAARGTRPPAPRQAELHARRRVRAAAASPRRPASVLEHRLDVGGKRAVARPREPSSCVGLVSLASDGDRRTAVRRSSPSSAEFRDCARGAARSSSARSPDPDALAPGSRRVAATSSFPWLATPGKKNSANAASNPRTSSDVPLRIGRSASRTARSSARSTSSSARAASCSSPGPMRKRCAAAQHVAERGEVLGQAGEGVHQRRGADTDPNPKSVSRL